MIRDLPGKYELPDQVRELLELDATPPDTVLLVEGAPGGRPRLGLVLKRTYSIGDDGRCELAAEDEQEVVVEAPVFCDTPDPPRLPPLKHDDESVAFRSATDLVIQGSAYTYDSNCAQTTVGLRLGGFRRVINVYGDRKLDFKRGGKSRFSEPEPFEEMPIRYDRAYGGVDEVAMKAIGLPVEFEELKAARPQWALDRATPFHYPRNPAGTGYLIRLNAAAAENLIVPNLEYPFDPIRPARLAVGWPTRWINGPLPAGLDWQGPSLFPRVGYFGLTPAHESRAADVAEVKLGWAASDLLEIESVLQTDPAEIRQEYFQAASPGMSFPDVPPGAVCEIDHMLPDQPALRVQIPVDRPDARLGINPPEMTQLEPHLNSVVIRPSEKRLTMTWCAHATVDRKYSPLQICDMRQQIQWDVSP